MCVILDKRRFGQDDRRTMISNESISILGPGPAAYDNLKPLKSLIHKTLAKGSPVMRQPSALDERVKKLLNVSSTEDLQK